MSLNDTINQILESASSITIGKVPENDGGGLFVNVELGVLTGVPGNVVQARCQRKGASAVECLENVLLDVKHVSDLRVEPSKVLRPIRKSGL